MVKGLLVTQHQTQHGVSKVGLVLEGDKSDRGDDPIIYLMALPAKT